MIINKNHGSSTRIFKNKVNLLKLFFFIQIGKKAEKKYERNLPAYTGTLMFTIAGIVFLVIIPLILFMQMEKWSLVDTFYFILITLSTIGFGDYVPSNLPPDSKGKIIKMGQQRVGSYGVHF